LYSIIEKDKMNVKSDSILGRLVQVGQQLQLSSTPEQQSIFLEIMGELLRPVSPLFTVEEAAFYHRKIDCLFPPSGVLGKKGQLEKVQLKRKITAEKTLSPKKPRLETNPFVKDDSSTESLIERPAPKTSSVEDPEQRALKRRFNQKLLRAEDRVLVVRGKKERASTSNTIYLVVPEDEPAAKKCKRDEVVSSDKVEKVEESESWDTLSEESDSNLCQAEMVKPIRKRKLEKVAEASCGVQQNKKIKLTPKKRSSKRKSNDAEKNEDRKNSVINWIHSWKEYLFG